MCSALSPSAIFAPATAAANRRPRTRAAEHRTSERGELEQRGCGAHQWWSTICSPSRSTARPSFFKCSSTAGEFAVREYSITLPWCAKPSRARPVICVEHGVASGKHDVDRCAHRLGDGNQFIYVLFAQVITGAEIGDDRHLAAIRTARPRRARSARRSRTRTHLRTDSSMRDACCLRCYAHPVANTRSPTRSPSELTWPTLRPETRSISAINAVTTVLPLVPGNGA